MQVTVQVSPDLARALQGSQGGPAESLRQTLAALGARIRPLHPGERDPVLATYFIVEAPSEDAANRAAALLRGHPGVEAAYIKPPDQPP